MLVIKRIGRVANDITENKWYREILSEPFVLMLDPTKSLLMASPRLTEETSPFTYFWTIPWTIKFLVVYDLR